VRHLNSRPSSATDTCCRYNDAVAAAFAVEHEAVGGSSACESAIRQGHQDILALMSDADGRQRLASLFGHAPEWCATPLNDME
jgi:hypothetical protein